MIKRVGDWFERRTGVGALLGPVLSHLVPRGSAWWYVFGSATLFAFLLQVVTGVALSFAYVPSSGQAYASLRFITLDSPIGHLLRGVHYFGASAMVLLVGLHMIRTFLFASYKYPREVSWISGAVLLLFTLAMGFTGQLLRWDQNAIWSVVVGAEQAGRIPLVGNALARFVLAGETLGGATLGRFFALHVFIFPAIIFIVLGLHLWLVIRNGISEPPEAGKPVDPDTYEQEYHALLESDGVPFWPDAAWRDVVFGVLMVVVVVGLAAVAGPPALGKAPDPTLLQALPKPDWYLLWYFGVLAVLPHGSEPYVIVLGPLLLGALLVVLPLFSNRGERHPLRRPWALGIVATTVVFIGSFWFLATKEPWSPKFDAPPLPQGVVGAVSAGAQHGAQLFYDKGCEYCHRVQGYGGVRGPDLSYVGDRLDTKALTWRIANGGYNMPAFAGTLTGTELDDLVQFLQTRKRSVRGEAAAGGG